MSAITWSVEADMSRVGTFDDDLTGYVEKPTMGLSINRGMGANGRYRTGRMTVGLSNKDGTFTPENTASAYHGELRPGAPIRLKATHATIDYTQYVGYWQSGSFAWRAGKVPTVKATCDDLSAWLHKFRPVDMAVASRVTGAAITTIIETNLGLAAGDHTTDTGAQTIPVHFVEGGDALSAIRDITLAELGGINYVTAAGLLRFEDRDSRIGLSGLSDTWGDGTNIVPSGIDYIWNEDEVISKVELQANIYVTNPATEVLADFSRNAANSESLSLTANQVYGPVRLDFGIPVSSIVTPAANIDYEANSAVDGTGSDQTANLTVTVTLQGAGYSLTLTNASGATIYVTKFQVRGIGEEFITDNPTFFLEKTIPGDKVAKGAQLQIPFADDVALLRDYAFGVLHTFRYAYPQVVLHFNTSHDDTKVALLTADLGDMILYKDSGLGVDFASNTKAGAFVDDWWYIVGITKHVPPNWAGENFRCSVRLEPAYLHFDPAKMAYDNFGRDDASNDLGISLSGDTWADDANMDIVSNKARANSDTLQTPNLDLGTSATDQVIESTLAAIGAGDEVGITGRYQDTSNFYNFYLDKGSNEAILEKNVAAAVTELSSPAFTVGTGHELRMIIQGSRIRCWADMKLVIDTTDSALTTGTKVGLWARNASGTTTFDDFHGRRI